MKQVNKPDKKAKTPMSDIRIHRRITEQELLKKIDEDPDSVFTDFDVKYGVERLGKWCRLGDDRFKKNGKRILKKAGLNAFIPKSSWGYLKVYKEYPGLFLAEAKERANKLKEVLPKRAKSDIEKLKAIQKLIDPKATVKSIRKYFPPKSRRDRTHIALGWIAYDNGVTYYRASNLYQKIKKTSSKVDTPYYLDDYKKAYKDYVIIEQIRPSIETVHMKVNKVKRTGTVLETVEL